MTASNQKKFANWVRENRGMISMRDAAYLGDLRYDDWRHLETGTWVPVALYSFYRISLGLQMSIAKVLAAAVECGLHEVGRQRLFQVAPNAEATDDDKEQTTHNTG